MYIFLLNLIILRPEQRSDRLFRSAEKIIKIDSNIPAYIAQPIDHNHNQHHRKYPSLTVCHCLPTSRNSPRKLTPATADRFSCSARLQTSAAPLLAYFFLRLSRRPAALLLLPLPVVPLMEAAAVLARLCWEVLALSAAC